MTAQHILEDNVCFNYITRVYSTQRDAQTNSVSASRLNKDIQIIHDPAKLRPLLNLRQEAMRAARGSGTKLEVLGCWLVPKENERSLSETFIDIGDRWDRFVAEASKIDRTAKGRGDGDAWVGLERLLLAIADAKAVRLLVA